MCCKFAQLYNFWMGEVQGLLLGSFNTDYILSDSHLPWMEVLQCAVAYISMGSIGYCVYSFGRSSSAARNSQSWPCMLWLDLGENGKWIHVASWSSDFAMGNYVWSYESRLCNNMGINNTRALKNCMFGLPNGRCYSMGATLNFAFWNSCFRLLFFAYIRSTCKQHRSVWLLLKAIGYHMTD